MYSVDGDFGQVKLIKAPADIKSGTDFNAPFFFMSAGWHRCNSLYRISRTSGCDVNMIFFSVTDGGVFQTGNNKGIRIPASSAAFLPAFCPHTYYTEPGKIWEFYWLSIPPDIILNFAGMFKKDSVLNISSIKRFTLEFERMITLSHANSHEFMTEGSRMISNIYHSLLSEFLRPGNTMNQDSMVNEIILSMKSSCEKEDWDLPALSKKYFISVPQLIRRFKAATGTTPHTYLTNLRLEKAEMLLCHTSNSVEEISKNTGFPCVANFIRQFQSRYGTTPGAYRRSRITQLCPKQK